MSSKSEYHHKIKGYFSKKMIIGAVLVLVVFGTIILKYPQLFSPAPAEVSKIPSSVAH
jgi:hypothetical protein